MKKHSTRSQNEILEKELELFARDLPESVRSDFERECSILVHSIRERCNTPQSDFRLSIQAVLSRWTEEKTLVETPDFLKEIMEHPLLDLEWPVSVHHDWITGNGISILSEKNSHSIYAEKMYFEHPERYCCGWVHELGHAVLAEKFDPLFASISCLPDEQIPRQDLESFRDCWQYVDIWVDDLMIQINSKLKEQDWNLFLGALGDFYNNEDLEKIADPRTIFGVAMAIGECKRRGVDPEPFLDFMNVYSHYPDIMETIRKFSDFCHNLPPLTPDKEENLRILEQTAQESAQIFGLKYVPYIIQKNGVNFFRLDSKKD